MKSGTVFKKREVPVSETEIPESIRNVLRQYYTRSGKDEFTDRYFKLGKDKYYMPTRLETTTDRTAFVNFIFDMSRNKLKITLIVELLDADIIRAIVSNKNASKPVIQSLRLKPTFSYNENEQYMPYSLIITEEADLIESEVDKAFLSVYETVMYILLVYEDIKSRNYVPAEYSEERLNLIIENLIHESGVSNDEFWENVRVSAYTWEYEVHGYVNVMLNIGSLVFKLGWYDPFDPITGEELLDYASKICLYLKENA